MTRRLLLTYVSFALLILLGLEVPLGYVHHRNEQQHAFEQLEHDAEVLAAFVDTALAGGDRAQLDILARETAQRLGGDVDVVDAAGALLTSTHLSQAEAGHLAGASDIRSVLSGQGRVSTRTRPGVMSVAVPVHPGIIAQGAIRVSVPDAALRSRIQNFWLLLAGAGVIVLAAAGLLAYALARWISRPVRALEQATRQLASDTPPIVLQTSSGPPELRRLAATFSATADRLQTLIAAQRSFTGHASHQLKTPLAALRLRLENLEADIAEPGSAGGRNLRAALCETDRLAQMVELLLAMARCDQADLPRTPMSLAAAVSERLDLLSPLAASGGVTLSVAVRPDCPVLAVSGAVEQILDNLVSNALRAAPSGSTVAVCWELLSPDLVALHVIDAGPGLTDAQLSRALDPFWRAPDAPKGGTGLGLALVRRLAEVSGGSATLRHGPSGTGVDAMVLLPLAPAGLEPALLRSGPVPPGTCTDAQSSRASMVPSR
ncbi:sensor histidine kinase [Winogradskya humida]|uniref:histidine kinase n=1 Tax=Winogradskya humida TaxID=113566 RepID=A0ABQ3ZJA0_9ACTN|nr:HAMP domain-containing sensor histidine kinase [Actinoplanes humidus]GIE18578.1 two-component sensor histidine kinase [Actinoplanes humidus]